MGLRARAANKADQDIESVHQLRVSARRATAALQIYDQLLPGKRAKSIRKSLHNLRKAAGEARDLDVLAFRLATIAEQKPENHLHAVLAQVAADRKAAQKPLRRAYRKAKEQGFKRQCAKLLDKLRWHCPEPEPVLADFARARLRPLVDQFFAAASADLSDVGALHKLRISGKQVRYAMELLAGAFDDSFRSQLYPVFAEVQEKLGSINDHATAITLYRQWTDRASDTASRAELAELIGHEEMLLDQACQQFLEWWTAERDAALAARFDAVLRDPSQSTDVSSVQVNDKNTNLFVG